MLRRFSAILGIAVLTALAVPSVAHAADDPYTPKKPSSASLSGSTVTALCATDTPYLAYSVFLNDPEAIVSDPSASITLSDGETTTSPIALGRLANDALEGQVPWPSEFARSTSSITAVLSVGTDSVTSVAYPLVAPPCGAPAALAALPATGLSSPVLPLGIAGGAVVLAGVVLLTARRRAQR